MTDLVLTAPPGDASSWDSTARLYDVKLNLSKATHYFDGALLTSCFNTDGSLAFVGGLDQGVHVIDFSRSSKSCVGIHSAPVSQLVYAHDYSTLISGSWDASVTLWDLRSRTKSSTLSLPDKVYSIASVQSKLVIATASKNIIIYDIRNLNEPEQTRESPLRHQLRKVSCAPNGTSFAVSSVEGRVAIEYFDPDPAIQSKKYAFKCHRKGEVAYPVNSIEYHPVYGSFATGGADGIISTWDGANKKKLAQLGPYPTSIAAMSFSFDGSLLAIASSYTFEEGEKPVVPEDYVYVHAVNDSEVKPRQKLS